MGRQSNPSSTKLIIFPPGLPGVLTWVLLLEQGEYDMLYINLIINHFDHTVYHLFIPLHSQVRVTDFPKMDINDNNCNDRIRNLIGEPLTWPALGNILYVLIMITLDKTDHDTIRSVHVK